MPDTQIPLYLFTGFLEGGKTKFIQETLEDPRFNSGERTLVLQCEEGEEELDFSAYPPKSYVVLQTLPDPQLLTKEHLRELLEDADASRVVMEYNGMWQLSWLYNALPDTWAVYQEMCFVDSTTFLQYNTNLRSLVVDKLQSCELVVFNRFDRKNMDKMAFHKIVRALSRRTDIAYESADGQVEYDDIQDPLPFNINAPVIRIEDSDFALWYRDIMEEPKKYDGKTAMFRGMVWKEAGFPPKTFALGRHVMTCCVQDITYDCFAAEWGKADVLKPRQWVVVTAKIHLQRHKLYRGKGPVLQIEKLALTGAPKQQVATFY